MRLLKQDMRTLQQDLATKQKATSKETKFLSRGTIEGMVEGLSVVQHLQVSGLYCNSMQLMMVLRVAVGAIVAGTLCNVM